jgi:hypothetical protein
MNTAADTRSLRTFDLTAPLLLGAMGWFFAVVLASTSGALGALVGRFMPAYAGLVALGIILPVIIYRRSAAARAGVDAIGIRALTLMHAWRIPAALLFFYYGAKGALPLAFWLPAGVGDFLAGAYALTLLRGEPSAARYRSVHRLGFADFVSAVGLGLTFTILGDPRMALLTTLPMALIPLFGVGLSGASHIIALTRDVAERR